MTSHRNPGTSFMGQISDKLAKRLGKNRKLATERGKKLGLKPPAGSESG